MSGRRPTIRSAILIAVTCAFAIELWTAYAVRDPGVVANNGLMRGLAWAGSAGTRVARAFALDRPVRPGMRLVQTFFMLDEGLSSVTVFPYAAGPAGGGLTLELWRCESERQPCPEENKVLVKTEHVGGESLQANRPLTMRFSPQPSVQRWFEIDLVAGAAPMGDVGILTTRDDAYERGAFAVNGHRIPGDLVFETALRPRSAIDRFSERLGGAGIPVPAAVWVAALALCNIVFAAVALAFVRWWPQAIEASQASRI